MFCLIIIYCYFTPDLILQSYATIPDFTEKNLMALFPPSHSHSPDLGCVGAQRIKFLDRFLA